MDNLCKTMCKPYSKTSVLFCAFLNPIQNHVYISSFSQTFSYFFTTFHTIFLPLFFNYFIHYSTEPTNTTINNFIERI